MKKKFLISALLIGFLVPLIMIAVFSPFITSLSLADPAVPSQLVPKCDYTSLGYPSGYCTICDLYVLMQNILNYTYYGFAFPAGIIMLIYAGFLMVVPGIAGEKSGSYEKGKKVMLNTLIGIAIIFLAWLAIDTIIKILANQGLTTGTPAVITGYGPWNKIECTANLPPVNQTHLECQNNMCVSVPGAGPNANCTVGTSCGGSPPLKAWKCNTTPPTCSCAENSPGSNCQQISTVTCTTSGTISCPSDTEEQALAKILKPLCGGSKDCGNVGACDTLQAVADGQLPPVCFSGCTSASTCAQKNIHLSVTMLKALDATNQEGKKFIITSLTTGDHSANSLHYQGRAVDVVAAAGTSYTTLESSFISKGATYVQCEDKNRVKIPCNSQGVFHIHGEFP